MTVEDKGAIDDLRESVLDDVDVAVRNRVLGVVNESEPSFTEEIRASGRVLRPRERPSPSPTNPSRNASAEPSGAASYARDRFFSTLLVRGVAPCARLFRLRHSAAGMSRVSVRKYIRAGGPPGYQDAASSTSSDQRERTCSLNSSADKVAERLHR